MSSHSNYDRAPTIDAAYRDGIFVGWTDIVSHLRQKIGTQHRYTVALECYAGITIESLRQVLEESFPSATVVSVASAYKSDVALQELFASTLTEDPVFGKMHGWTIEDYFDATLLNGLKSFLNGLSSLTFVLGTGADYLLPHADLLLHAGVTRWELQQRQRTRKIGNLGFNNAHRDSPGVLYKNAFFLEWRVADAIRHSLYPSIDFFMDLDDEDRPSMVEGETLRTAVREAMKRPFRVVPFFDPGIWGGSWMKSRFDLPDGPPNYAWCFDCVPEENSVTFRFGKIDFRVPAILLVHEQPLELLGRRIFDQFGAEFPIRFDLLDTMDGDNLSLQVHPLKQYMQEHFGMAYTQDESYYILDVGEGAQLYLGLREGIFPPEMALDLKLAQEKNIPFPVERYINVWPVQKHDHFSIPAGTVHCSGRNTLVLEISATPYIFTFKLWDWGRLGLSGEPRPIHLEHGLANMQWERDTGWVQEELLNRVELLRQGAGWKEERTGLHSLEFLETRRTWFTECFNNDTDGNLHVLNLVQGDAVLIESPEQMFAPMVLHYAETVIMPAAAGQYTIRPQGEAKTPFGIVKAYVREFLPPTLL